MKKTLAILLTLAMMLLLIAACADNGGTAPTPGGNDSNNDNAATGEAPPVGDPIIGTTDEVVDHHARRTYRIAYTHYDNSILQEQMYEAFVSLQEKYNFELVRMTGNTDDEIYITNLETLIDRGDIDGFIIETTNSVQNAVLAMMERSGIPSINLFTEYFDAQGRVVTPTVGLRQHDVGFAAMQYLIDNRETWWGDVDSANFGVIGIDFSVSPALHYRTQGFLDAFREAFPGNENVFEWDSFAAGQAFWFALEGGFDPTIQIASANPHVTHWFVGGTVESYSMGAARAAEDLGRDDQFLVTTVGHPLIVDEWNNGYDGSKRAVVAISNYAYATPTLLGLIALIDGRATPETLWPQYLNDGDLRAVWEATSEIITRDNYQDFLDRMERIYGP
ncbi:MAG: substrate-binding domain-containing protein [Oscillospiraceae bacterium]|nr:substrate-binding domain-containing protein [Oscillospiraceae bacterium]